MEKIVHELKAIKGTFLKDLFMIAYAEDKKKL